MEAKEKAIELIIKFRYQENYTLNIEVAKQCALICVDEIIKSLRKDLPATPFGKGYWYSVRKELENL